MIERPAPIAHGRKKWPVDLGRAKGRATLLASFVLLALAISAADAGPLSIVAAENFYGDIARQIGGADVAVTSILNSPDRDPHEFETNPSTARAFARAAVVIYNGADYDLWATKLLSALSSPPRQTIEVADLTGAKPGDNPHVWYDPDTAAKLAETLADKLALLDPSHRAGYQHRLAAFERSLKPLAEQIEALRRKNRGMPVTATEPVFGYMAAALGFEMRNAGFQRAVMNDTEPSAANIAAFENDLRSRAVKVLIYNRQTTDALTLRMRAIAQQSGIPVVGVTETEPAGEDYQQWMRSQLEAIDRALTH
ncbi:MAG: zinc ABC transporter substrate-binding protein [Alphaproteobacteria bacterium]|nr:zinc ABC transporter substrate-binding protein [Alphaproteobacteria bacterium]